MSKETARSWKLMIVTIAVVVGGSIIALNVGAAAHRESPGPVTGAVQPSESSSSSSSTSASPSPEDTCSPVPPPICENETPSPSVSPSASTSPTPGGGDTEKSKISIAYSSKKEAFKGGVDSSGKCEKGRRVDLFEVRPGKDAPLGHTVTAKKGKYTIPYPNANGRYYTKVKQSKPSRNLTCKGAQSKTISV